MKKSILIFAIALFTLSCKQTNKKNIEQNEIVPDLVEQKLSPLTAGEYSYNEKDFGEIIELTGTSHPVDHIFRVSECEMIALDSVLIVKNRNNQEIFMAYTLPDFKFIKSFGRLGKGPGEFQFPRLVKCESKEYLCYIYEQANSHIYSLDKNFEIAELPVGLKQGETNYNVRQLYGISSDNMLYVENITGGKAILSMKSDNDTVITSQLINLSFSNRYKNWAAYTGDFSANGKKNRAVFAYKYFKRLLFLDLENNTSKTVLFDQQEKTDKGDASSMLAPSNVTHYWGMSSQDKYVYVLYSGRTPIDVSKELKESSGYIYLEKFDWNGNPVSKYKLDHWGYFCVSEDENTIYVASTVEEHPFFSYHLHDE